MLALEPSLSRKARAELAEFASESAGRPLNVLALVTDAFGGRGGIAQYNRDFLTALAQCPQRVETRVVPRSAPDPVVLPKGVTQAAARFGRIGYSLAALRAALGWHVDVVFCGHVFMAPLGLLIARLRGARFVVQTHGVDVWQAPHPVQRLAFQAADLVLCVSRHTREIILEWADIAPEKLVVVPNTVGTAFTPGEGAPMRRQLGLEGKKVLLTVGRLDSREQYKGHDRVIGLMPGLLDQGHDVAYVVVGEGDDLARLQGLARAAGVAERVLFLGARPLADLVEIYRMADLFVMPSAGEGFGIVYLEAMACGTPAVGLPVGGATDALEGLGALAGEAELPQVVASLLAQGKPDPKALARAVQSRFGWEPFRRQVWQAMARLGSASAETSA